MSEWYKIYIDGVYIGECKAEIDTEYDDDDNPDSLFQQPPPLRNLMDTMATVEFKLPDARLN